MVFKTRRGMGTGGAGRGSGGAAKDDDWLYCIIWGASGSGRPYVKRTGPRAATRGSEGAVLLIRNETPQNYLVDADQVTVKVVDEVPIVEANKGGKVCATFFVDALTGYMPTSAFQEMQHNIGFARAEDAET